MENNFNASVQTVNIYNNTYNYNPTKHCNRCYQLKPLTEFYYRTDTNCYKSECNDCRHEYQKQYYQNHKEKIRLYEKHNQPRRNELRRERYHNDEEYKLKNNLRCRLYQALQPQGIRKTNTTLELTGCTLEFLNAWLHFTKNFYAPYSVNTHIDHVYPCARFNLQDVNQQLDAFNWKNLRVIDASDNMHKSDRLPTQDEIITHQNLIYAFLHMFSSAF